MVSSALVEMLDINARANLHNVSTDRLGGVLEQETCTCAQRIAVHPDHGRFKVPRSMRRRGDGRDHVAAAEIGFVLERKYDGLGRFGGFEVTVPRGD